MWTRESHDPSAYKHEVYESVRPGNYWLEPNTVHRSDTCFQETPEIHAGGNVGRSQYNITLKNDMVDIESDLKNLIRKQTKDPRGKFPYIQKSYGNAPSMKSCENRMDLARSYPLLEAPAFKREQQIDVPRFESLCLDPQRMNRIRSNQYIGLNTRLFKRDRHIPKAPKKVQQTEKFVSMAPIKKEKTWEDFFGQQVSMDFCSKGPQYPEGQQCRKC